MEIEVDDEKKLTEILDALQIEPENVSRLSIVELQNRLEEEVDDK